MGHEVVIYGCIIAPGWRVGPRFQELHERNRAVLRRLPREDDWPWVVRGRFARPGPTYRSQVIHFGLSLKDDPTDRGVWSVWLGKFEAVLRQLCWESAVAHVTTELAPDRTLHWTPTDAALAGLYSDPPAPVAEWTREARE